MKLFFIFVAIIILQGCVLSTDYGAVNTGNSFYFSLTDSAGNELKTGASVDDPLQFSMLKEMYVKLVVALWGTNEEAE